MFFIAAFLFAIKGHLTLQATGCRFPCTAVAQRRRAATTVLCQLPCRFQAVPLQLVLVSCGLSTVGDLALHRCCHEISSHPAGGISIMRLSELAHRSPVLADIEHFHSGGHSNVWQCRSRATLLTKLPADFICEGAAGNFWFHHQFSTLGKAGQSERFEATLKLCQQNIHADSQNAGHLAMAMWGM